MITSYNITFTTPLRLRFPEKWLKFSIKSKQIYCYFNCSSLLPTIILYNCTGPKFDTLPYYRINIKWYFVAKMRLKFINLFPSYGNFYQRSIIFNKDLLIDEFVDKELFQILIFSVVSQRPDSNTL